MTANQFDVLDADQPIPLGRPAAAAMSPAAQSAAELSPDAPVLDANVEPAPVAPTPAAVEAEPEVVPAIASTTPVCGVGPAAPQDAKRSPSDAATQPHGHPLHGLRSFRLEPIPIDQPYGGRRDLVRFLVQFALVMAFVYALIVAFVLLVAHVRGTPA